MDGMAAEKIIPFEIFEDKKNQRQSVPQSAMKDRILICLQEARQARALDVFRAGTLDEQKSLTGPSVLDLSEYRQQIYEGGYCVDTEDLAETILDTLFIPK